eukprot:m.196008 g.196008  ORF g.196008 m.196008 type:complete len:460 (+) comp25046_c0_seq1:97-1476(+)
MMQILKTVTLVAALMCQVQTVVATACMPRTVLSGGDPATHCTNGCLVGTVDTVRCCGVECDLGCVGSFCAQTCRGKACGAGCTGNNCADKCGECESDAIPDQYGEVGECGLECGMACTGINCAFECKGDRCGKFCTGANCAASCEGAECGRVCGGVTCAQMCTGDNCGEKCRGASCASGCGHGVDGGATCGAECDGASCAQGCFGAGCGKKCKGASCAQSCNPLVAADPLVPSLEELAANAHVAECGAECEGASCAFQCRGALCGTECSGASCAAQCVGFRCAANCKTPGCNAGCADFPGGRTTPSFASDDANNHKSCDCNNDSPFNPCTTLVATMAPYPDYVGDAPTGTVTVVAGIAGTLSVSYNMQNLPENSDQGVHIHVGTTCENVNSAGGHYWTPPNSQDGWNDATVRWSSNADGVAIGSFTVSSGYPIADNVGHVVVVHSGTGTRVGCGVLVLV